MPTDTPADVEEVLRLDREATPGPWRAVDRLSCVEIRSPSGKVFSDGSIQSVATAWEPDGHKPDGRLIATYRTAAPALARELEQCREMLQESVNDCFRCDGSGKISNKSISDMPCPKCTRRREYLAKLKGGQSK